MSPDSVTSPVRWSMATTSKAPNRRSISARSRRSPGDIMPAASRTLRRRSSSALDCWRSRSVTAEADTSTAQTTQTAKAKRSVYCTELRCDTCLPPSDVRADDVVVDRRGEHVHEEDRQHHPFGIRRVDDPDEYGQHADQRAVDPVARQRVR